MSGHSTDDPRVETLARLFVTRIALRCSTYNQHGSCATCNGMAEVEAGRAIAALEAAGYTVRKCVCDGSYTCPAQHHIHGCFRSTAADEHRPASPAAPTEPPKQYVVVYPLQKFDHMRTVSGPMPLADAEKEAAEAAPWDAFVARLRPASPTTKRED